VIAAKGGVRSRSVTGNCAPVVRAYNKRFPATCEHKECGSLLQPLLRFGTEHEESGRRRSRFRSEADHRSGAKPISGSSLKAISNCLRGSAGDRQNNRGGEVLPRRLGLTRSPVPPVASIPRRTRRPLWSHHTRATDFKIHSAVEEVLRSGGPLRKSTVTIPRLQSQRNRPKCYFSAKPTYNCLLNFA
jgi:hypothetical protein